MLTWFYRLLFGFGWMAQCRAFLDGAVSGMKSGPVEARIEKGYRALQMVDDWLARIVAALANVYKSFAHEREYWFGKKPAAGETPWASPEDTRRALIFLSGAVFVILPECLLSGYFLSLTGIAFWVGFFVPAVLVIPIHAGCYALLEKKGEPTTMLESFKTKLIRPSFLLFAVSVVCLLFGARISTEDMSEEWASTVALTLDLALYGLSFGCVMLSAGLLTSCEIALWCWSLPKFWQDLTLLQGQALKVREQLCAELLALGVTVEPVPVAPSPTPAPDTGKPGKGFVNGLARSMSASLLALCLLASPALAQEQECRVLEVHLDHSGSTWGEAITSAMTGLVQDLPQLVAEQNICRVRVWSFATNGFAARKLFDLELPRYADPPRKQLKPKHIEMLVPDMLAKRQALADTGYDKAKRQAREDHRMAVNAVLSALTVEALTTSPLSVSEDGCSNIYDSLQRVRLTRSEFPVLVLWFSDGFHSCSAPLQPVPAPQGEVTAVGILLGEKVQMMIAQQPGTKGKAAVQTKFLQGGYEEYAQRLEALQQAAPWMNYVSQHAVDNHARLFSKPRTAANP